jgi:hypothetical protein
MAVNIAVTGLRGFLFRGEKCGEVEWWRCLTAVRQVENNVIDGCARFAGL